MVLRVGFQGIVAECQHKTASNGTEVWVIGRVGARSWIDALGRCVALADRYFESVHAGKITLGFSGGHGKIDVIDAEG